MNNNNVETTDKGTQCNLEHTWKEYEYCSRLEQDLVRSRWTFFTAMLTVSFVVAGLTLSQHEALGPVLGKCSFAFGWLIAMAGFYHYWWFLRLSQKLRNHLCNLEVQLDIKVYRIRAHRIQVALLPESDKNELDKPSKRPEIFGFIPLYYRWVIYALAVAYTVMLVVVLFSRAILAQPQ